MRVMAIVALALAPAGAWAADFSVAPPAGWVQPVSAPPVKQADGAFDIRLIDLQLHFDAAGMHQYLHQVVRVLQPQALQAIGTFGAVWQPATDTIRFHRVVIHRAGADIDVLKDGSGLQVIRREAGLEAALIDGKLTATMPVPDLRVGDEIEFAYTISSHNPVFGAHQEADQLFARSAQVDRLYVRNSWPAAGGMRWRIGSGLPKPVIGKTADGQTVLTVDQADFLAPPIPAQSPGRFIDANRLQTSDFADWQALSALFASMFDAAATPAADSPLRAEIARIAAASSDPKARALAALQLVQSQIRYLARMDGLGGYQPASADAVWKERLGDCKGKTVLLLALLRGLGVDAQAAIVSVQQSDGVDASLPMAGRFDHVLVRATIAGKVYWLDGTRLGDRDLDQIAVPGFQSALPLTRPGSGLVRLVATEPALPTEEWTLDLDARAGIAAPAKVTGIAILRGDGASGLRTALSFLSETQRKETLRKIWAERHDWVEIADTSYSADDKTGEVRLGFTGTGKMDWDVDGKDASHRYHANKAFLGQTLAPERAPGDPDVPVKVDERYTVTHQTILLPDNGKGFTIDGDPIDRTEGGLHYVRTASLHDGKFEMTASTRSKAGEITLAAAKAADKQATDIFNQNLYVRLPADKLAISGKGDRPKSGGAAAQSGPRFDQIADMINRNAWADATKLIDDGLTANPKSAELLALRARILVFQDKWDAADAALDEALSIDNQQLYALATKADLLTRRNRPEDALIVYDRMILFYPNNFALYRVRAGARLALGKNEGALADYELLLGREPDDAASRGMAIELLLRLHRMDEALATAEEGVKRAPDDAISHGRKGDVLAFAGRRDEARSELQRSIALKPHATAYHTLLDYDLIADPKDRLSAMLAMIADNPGYPIPPHALKSLVPDQAAYAALIAAYDKAGAPPMHVASSSQPRDEVDMAFNHPDLVSARIEKAIADHPRDAMVLNDACWFRATHRIDLDRALANCDAAIAIDARPAFLDSRGLVRLQQGAWQAALADYDAALAKVPLLAQSLFGRGLAKRRLGNSAGGNADLDAARSLLPRIDAVNADYGLTP